ncbi:TPA: 3-deoxy-D-manno-octulosonate 8-phosphate phosphatase, partial [Mannheimia haemolytica]|nr:3-deoxy-D-manno-octulosonate 8-phosphate phosphatase [Mannheimia haemolytica]
SDQILEAQGFGEIFKTADGFFTVAGKMAQ